MTKVVSTFNNLARAKIDHDLHGRFDLPIYKTGADIFRNFLSNFKGNGAYRPGFEDMLLFQDCAFVEFKFSISQNYIIVMYNLKMRFVSYDGSGNFGWVESSPGVPLEVTTPYTLAQSKEIAKGKPSQNFDGMIFTHLSHRPRKLIRTSATSFTFLKYARKDDPFGLTYAATKTITAITKAANAQITAAAHGYSVDDEVKILAVVGMTEINSYTARVVSVVGVNDFTIDVDTTTFTAYSSGGTAAKLLTSDNPSQNLFYKARLWYAATTLKPTTVYASEAGQYFIHTLPATVTDISAMQFTIADISQKIEWLFPGENSLIAGSADGIVAINGGGVNTAITSATVEANLTSAPACNGVYPVTKDGLIFYMALNGRNMIYFDFDLLSEKFIGKDANLVSYDITLGGLTKLRYKKDRNDLIYGLRGDLALTTCNFNNDEKIIGWHEHIIAGMDLAAEIHDVACITDNDGAPQIFALNKYGSAYYIERQSELVEFVKRTDFFTKPSAETEVARKVAIAADNEAYNRYIAEQLKECIYLDNALTYSNLQSNLITYSSGGGTITATSNVFVIGDIGKHIVYKTATGYESGRFEITGYTSAKIVTVDVLQEPTANTYTDWYLSFDTVSGLSQYNGTTVGVVTDGGYLDDFDVTGGAISFDSQVTHMVIGYKFKGIIGSFPMGFEAQGQNVQATQKVIAEINIRLTASAGGQIGSSLYKLQRVQELSQNDLNYLPPLPIDGTHKVIFSDDNEQDKYWYAVQDEPLPFNINAIMINCNYTVTP